MTRILFSFQCKGAKLIIQIFSGHAAPSDQDATSGPVPFCRFVNVQLQGVKAGSGVNGSRGTLLLENPRGDFVLTKDEMMKQVSGVTHLVIFMCAQW